MRNILGTLSATFIFNSVLTWSFSLWAVSSCVLQLHLRSEEMALWAPWTQKACTYGLIGLLGNGTTQCVDDDTKSVYFFRRIPNSDVFFLEYFWHIPFWPGRGGGSRMAEKEESTLGGFWNPGAPLGVRFHFEYIRKSSKGLGDPFYVKELSQTV